MDPATPGTSRKWPRTYPPAYDVKQIPAVHEAYDGALYEEDGADQGPVHAPHLWRFFLYSGIGIFAFFVPFTWNEKRTILLDHIVTLITKTLGTGTQYLSLIHI